MQESNSKHNPYKPSQPVMAWMLRHRMAPHRPWLVIGIACSLAVLMRLIDSPMQNLGFMAVLALFTGAFLKHPLGILIPLGARLLTDVLIHLKTGYGFFPSWPADYSAYLVIGLLGWYCIPSRTGHHVKSGAMGFAGGVLAACIYFLVSNFGVWCLWPETYPRSFAGLVDCYVMAIPFARGTFIGNPVAGFVFFATAQWLTQRQTVSAGVPRGETVS